MSKLLCLNCGTTYDTKLVNYNYQEDYNFCPNSACLGQIVEIDDNMVSSIRALNTNQIFTKFCCGGHTRENCCNPYIMFDNNIEMEDLIILRNALVKYCAKGWKVAEFIDPTFFHEQLFTYSRITSQTCLHDLLNYITPSFSNEGLTLRGNPGFFTLSKPVQRQYINACNNIYRNYIKLIEFANLFYFSEIKNIDISTLEQQYLGINTEIKLTEKETTIFLYDIGNNSQLIAKIEDEMNKRFNQASELTQQNLINELNCTLNKSISKIISSVKVERKYLQNSSQRICSSYFGL